MKVELESTSKQVLLNGIPCRIWEGRTDRGTPIHAFVALVGISDDPAAIAELDSELNRSPAPGNADIEAYPPRMVL